MTVLRCKPPRKSHKWRVTYPDTEAKCTVCGMGYAEAYESPASKAAKVRGKKK